MLSTFPIMAKSTETASTKSSVASSRAASLKKSVKAGAKVIVRPFKKLKQSLSTTRSTVSRSSTALALSEDEADNPDEKSDTDDGNSRSSSAPELTPEQELGQLIFYLFHFVI